jgi:alanine transaminase
MCTRTVYLLLAAILAAVQSKRLTLDTMHPGLKHMEYAVRGKVVIKADQIAQELLDKKMANQPNQRPYDHVVYTNIGNPHSVGQKPLTWPRQVLALVDLPPQVGVDHPDVARLFPADAIARARVIQDVLHNYGSGAYSHSQGARGLRQDVADFIQQRDGVCLVRWTICS